MKQGLKALPKATLGTTKIKKFIKKTSEGGRGGEVPSIYLALFSITPVVE